MKPKIIYSLAILLAIVLIAVLLLFRGTTTMKNEAPYTTARLPENPIYYIASWEVHDLYCGINFNDGILFDNSGFSQGDAQSQFDLMTFIHNGRNRIALDVASWGWWDPEIKGDQFDKRAQITNKDAYCQLSVKAKSFPDGEEKEIAFLKVSVNDDYQLQIDSSMRDYDSQQSPARTVSSQVVNRQGVLGNATHNMVFNAGRDIDVSGVPDWEWVSAPRFDDIPNAREQLEDAYRELWQVFKDKDQQQLENMLAMGIVEKNMGKLMLAADKLSSEYDLNMNARMLGYDLNNSDYEMQPLNFDNYRVEQYADGRIVRFVENLYKTNSPIIFLYTDEKGNQFEITANQFFSFINGKFKVVR